MTWLRYCAAIDALSRPVSECCVAPASLCGGDVTTCDATNPTSATPEPPSRISTTDGLRVIPWMTLETAFLVRDTTRAKIQAMRLRKPRYHRLHFSPSPSSLTRHTRR